MKIMTAPNPIHIFRLTHVDNLPTLLKRGGLHSSNHTPNDNLPCRTTHDVEIQLERHVREIPCGPGGTLHDYIPFYFGVLSPMLYKLKTGGVAGYTEGQTPLIYLVSDVQTIDNSGVRWVFSDGHGIAAFTKWFDQLADLNEIDWVAVRARYWKDDKDHMDRQRRKQAEFLVHKFCSWTLIREIGVVNITAKARVEQILSLFDTNMKRPINIRPAWYY